MQGPSLDICCWNTASRFAVALGGPGSVASCKRSKPDHALLVNSESIIQGKLNQGKGLDGTHAATELLGQA